MSRIDFRRRPCRRLAAGCAALACTLLLFFPRAGSAGSWVRVVREDDRGLEIVLRAPEPEGTAETLAVPGFTAGGDAGLPIVYERAVRIGVPGPAGADLAVLDVQRREFGEVAPRIMPALRRRDPLHEPHRASAPTHEWVEIPAAPLARPYPAEAVTLSGPSRIRGRDAVTLHFRPLQYRPDGGASYVSEARVRITFRDRAQRRAGGGRAEEPFHAALLNAGTSSRWALGAPSHAPGARARSRTGSRPGALPAQRLRIRIRERGVYALPFDRLLAAGVPVDDPGFDPRTLRLVFDSWRPQPLFADSTPASWQLDYEMQEAAIWVQGEEDGSFDIADRVVFYALGPREYVDLTGFGVEDSLAHAQHPYDRFNYGWLVWGEAPGLRMQTLLASAPEPLVDPLVDRVWHREHFEEDRYFGTVDDLWYWSSVRPTRPASVTFDLDLAGAPSASGEVRVGIGTTSFSRLHALHVHVNGVLVGDIEWGPVTNRPPNQYFSFPAALAANNQLELSTNTALDPDGTTLFLKFDVSWERPLAATSGRLVWSARPQGARQVYQLDGFGAQEPLVLDVTDPLRPVRLTDPTPVGTAGASRWRVRHGRGAGQRAHYTAVSVPRLPGASDLELRITSALRQRATSPDMLIVVHESLLQAAERLAEHRRAHFPEAGSPDVLVVSTTDIYENFSGGRMDPLAIRNYVKLLYELEAEPRLRYLLLFGEATHDPRRLRPESTPTLVPTVHAWYADDRVRRENAVDDWFAEMEAPPFDTLPWRLFPAPDLAVGRLTPRTPSEAERVVDKLIAFDTSTDFGAWRTRALMLSDDECSPRGCFDRFFILNTETLVDLVPTENDVVKIYLTEYPRILGQKPQARQALIEAWSEGAALINYVGHGAPRQLADEVLFLATDVPALANGGRLPLFMALSCTVAEFDGPEFQSMAEDMVASSAGGAIAAIGATIPTFATPNQRLNEQYFIALFSAGVTSAVPLGIVHQMGKNNSPESNGVNNEAYVLLGDPATTLLAPQALVGFTSGADTLLSGRQARIEGIVHLPGDSLALGSFDGQADVEVFASADESGYTSPDDPRLHIDYDLLGAPIFRGRVPVVGGRFEVRFTVPVLAGVAEAASGGAVVTGPRASRQASSLRRPRQTIRLGSKCRLSAYASDSEIDAKGGRSDVAFVRSGSRDASTSPPRIVLHFPSNASCVQPGTPLLAEIRDENGINIQATTPRTSILLAFDGRDEPLDVTARLRSEMGSDTLGTLSVPLPEDLEPGPHRVTLTASDNLLNTSSARLDFEVASSRRGLANVLAFPNPFRDRTWFVFDLGEPAAVDLRVFTSSGREVWRHRQRYTSPGQIHIRWGGVDSAGDGLANGTYIYHLVARPDRAGGSVLRHTGKIVVMRE
ncbi:MAG: C25 family cysteine peptidase [Candidatus Krumholzibacteriia bacterium]